MFANRGWSRSVWGMLAVLTVAVIYAQALYATERFSPDAYLYQRMVLEDRGVSPAAALAQVRAFYNSKPESQSDSDATGLYTDHPPAWYVAQYPLFRGRPLLPWLGARLYPALGFRALDWIAAGGIVVACGAIYVLLLGFVPPWLAALGALAASTTTLLRDIGTVAGTDGPAYAFWSICLVATLWYARRASPATLTAAVLANVLLGFTRPAIWLAPAAAAALVVAAYYGNRARLRPALTLLVAQIAVGIAVLGYTAAVHGASFFELVRWQYAWHVARGQHWTQYGVWGWYAVFVLRDLAVEPLRLLQQGAPALAITAAATGLWRLRRDPRVIAMAGVAAVAPLAIFANPPDFDRALEIPLTPIVVTGLCVLLYSGMRARPLDSAVGDLQQTRMATVVPFNESGVPDAMHVLPPV